MQNSVCTAEFLGTEEAASANIVPILALPTLAGGPNGNLAKY